MRNMPENTVIPSRKIRENLAEKLGPKFGTICAAKNGTELFLSAGDETDEISKMRLGSTKKM